MSSPISPLSDIDPTAITARPSYESFLRIKQGIGSEALRAAGLPSVENLSYDAYVAALNRKAAETRAAGQPRNAKAPADAADIRTAEVSKAGEAKRLAWTSVVVVPVALVAVILIVNMFNRPSDGTAEMSSSEAVAAPLVTDGLPVALSLTAVDEMPSQVLPADDAATTEPAANFDHEVAAAEAAAEKVELLPASKPVTEAVPVTATKKKKSAAAREPSPATVLPVQERRVVAAQPEKKAATPTRKVAKKEGDFWQPLVDLLDGKGLRGARNVPPPEDRVGR